MRVGHYFERSLAIEALLGGTDRDLDRHAAWMEAPSR